MLLIMFCQCLCKRVLYALDLLPPWVEIRAGFSVSPLLGLGGDCIRRVMVNWTET